MKEFDFEDVEMRAKMLLKKIDATPSMYINDISRLFHMRVKSRNGSQDFCGSQGRMLFHLAQNDGLTQLELVKLTHLTPPSISVALSKMESEGLVLRVTDKNDLRQVRVYLTDKGRAIDARVKENSGKTEDEMLMNLSEDEQQELKRLLSIVLETLVGKDE